MTYRYLSILISFEYWSNKLNATKYAYIVTKGTKITPINVIHNTSITVKNNNEYKIKDPNWTYSTAKAEEIDKCIEKLIEIIEGNPKQN